MRRPFWISLALITATYLLFWFALIAATAGYSTPEAWMQTLMKPEIRYATLLSLVTCSIAAAAAPGATPAWSRAWRRASR